MDKIVFNLENENGFFCVWFFLLSSYIFACKTNKLLYIKDDKWKFLYKNGLDDYFLLNKNIIKYDYDFTCQPEIFGHMKEPNMLHSLKVNPNTHHY